MNKVGRRLKGEIFVLHKKDSRALKFQRVNLSFQRDGGVIHSIQIL